VRRWQECSPERLGKPYSAISARPVGGGPRHPAPPRAAPRRPVGPVTTKLCVLLSTIGKLARSGNRIRRWDDCGRRRSWSSAGRSDPKSCRCCPGKADTGKLGFAAQLAPFPIPRLVSRRPWSPTLPSKLERLPRSLVTIGRAGAGGAIVKPSSPFSWSCRSTRRPWWRSAAGLWKRRCRVSPTLQRWRKRSARGSPAAVSRGRPGVYRLDRIVRAARVAHDEQAFRAVADRLDAETRHRLGGLLADDGTDAAFTRLQADPGRVGLESLLAEIGKLDLVCSLKLPPTILKPYHPELIKRFRRRAATETAWELRRHPEHIRLPLLVFYCVPREARSSTAWSSS
jgi:hypothetical protein